MIGFKETPIRLVGSIFLISIVSILLIYIDSLTNEPIPEEEITISQKLDSALRKVKNKRKH